MKFKDIKVGDFVYDLIKIPVGGWGRTFKNFFVKREVTKVTPKQFEVSGRRCKFRKEDGTAVGDVGFVYKEGESYRKYAHSELITVKDQTTEAVVFKELTDKYREIGILASKLNLTADQIDTFSYQIEEIFDNLKILDSLEG